MEYKLQHPTYTSQYFRGSSLKVKEVMREIAQVHEWLLLGVELDIPVERLEEIKRNNPGDVAACKLLAVDHWLKNDTKASWSGLSDALEHIGHAVAAGRVRQRYGLQHGSDHASRDCSVGKGKGVHTVPKPEAEELQTATLHLKHAATGNTEGRSAHYIGDGLQHQTLQAQEQLTAAQSWSIHHSGTHGDAAEATPSGLSVVKYLAAGLRGQLQYLEGFKGDKKSDQLAKEAIYDFVEKCLQSSQALHSIMFELIALRRPGLLSDSLSQWALQLPVIIQQKFQQAIVQTYKPRHGHLHILQGWKFTRNFVDMVKCGNEGNVRAMVTEEAPGVYSFEMLTSECCRELLEEVEHIKSWCRVKEVEVMPPNTMNRYGVVLDNFGFESALGRLITQYIQPLVTLLYPTHDQKLDRHHGVVVEYELGKQTSLGFHTDGSEVTVDVCLGYEFTGAELYFGGVRCAKHKHQLPRDGEYSEVQHQVGRGILYLGDHRHGIKELCSGSKSNLVIWCNSGTLQACLSRHDNCRPYLAHQY